ncbi:hypothetical protein V2E39_20230 [Chryseobacterium arthrosphaerae]|uniref:DUF7674 domain-containing protein n=1 Tax=Chryseobacterium arthrosphaerae TaxID=651561 RepID=A0A1B8ZTJ3_9FLAO|nr:MULTISPECIES: hypothetical protein [Chryseobacterium]AYZ13337.1 hypothetical protein EGY05_15980 [Chryseobacterium arthrosphaerae]MDG4652403.1 hypothetical protein [Chryseobacterium arthrosphaerae]OCA74908.1 hypothetical protein BBI00_11450 [Chryseobacterium arthrosphaerae]QUY54158.1 hypothetical protein I2F65_14840 [Chryseobacterium arthrosphaerae]UEQ78635.1 hypothetical protein J8N07_10160 [Chryseobacterium arthrosphaerae]
MMKVQMQTINQKIAVEYLKFFYPPLRNEITQLSVQDNFAGIMQATVNYLKNLLQESKINIIAHHIKLMDWIYRNGNSYVRTMIENLFVRSFESFKKHAKIQHWKLLYQYMPVSFQIIYNEQQKQDQMYFGK